MSETTRSASDQRLVDQAKELRLQGMTIPQVAKAVDRSPSWVSKVVGPMTAPKPKPPTAMPVTAPAALTAPARSPKIS